MRNPEHSRRRDAVVTTHDRRHSSEGPKATPALDYLLDFRLIQPIRVDEFAERSEALEAAGLSE